MLHLVPIRWVIAATVVAAAMIVLATVYAGWVTEASSAAAALVVIRWASLGSGMLIVAMFAGWRWFPPAQAAIFPYLGGQWSGTLKFQGDHGSGERAIKLEVKHTLFTLRLLLDSSESSSSTLVVHADRDRHFERYRLLYVYANERKDGLPGAGNAYRGLAVMRVEMGSPLRLEGSYFTEQNGRGTLSLAQTLRTPWWKLWQ